MTILPTIPLPSLAFALALCLAVSSIGFRRTDYFVSLGYAFSIAAQAVVFALAYGPPVDGWAIAQAALMMIYGLRLGGFLIGRDNRESFERELEASKQRSRHIRGAYKFAIWGAVSLLYVAMFAPAHLGLLLGRTILWSMPPGVVLMVVGLALETAADWQKSVQKARAPDAFVQSGLFAVVRYPNYFGEMLFWLGVFLSGIAAYRNLGDWLLAGAGFVAIELIMLGSARRLELKQAASYGDEPAFRAYAAAVPVLFPLVPLYSLRRLRVYLG